MYAYPDGPDALPVSFASVIEDTAKYSPFNSGNGVHRTTWGVARTLPHMIPDSRSLQNVIPSQKPVDQLPAQEVPRSWSRCPIDRSRLRVVRCESIFAPIGTDPSGQVHSRRLSDCKHPLTLIMSLPYADRSLTPSSYRRAFVKCPHTNGQVDARLMK